MAEKKADEKQAFRVEIAPRRPSLTSRLIGMNREWMNNFYQSQEEDDQQYGHGFNDPADEFVGGVIYNERRRRNSSVSSDTSEAGELAAGFANSGTNRVRTGSISERVAGMQLHRKPKTSLESFAITSANIVDDQT